MTNRREFFKQASIGIVSILALRSEIFAAKSKLKFIIPAYFSASEHSDLWKRMIDSCQKDDIIILNPNSGPDTSVNDAYKQFVTQAKNKGIVIAGYVHTHNNYSKPNQQKRCLDSLKIEIEAYQTMYGVKDIFFDEVATAPEKLNEAVGYYKTLCDPVNKNGGITILNPGVISEKEYACLSDVVIIFESSFKKYKNQNDWEWTIDSRYKNKIAHLIYETPQNNLADVLKIAIEKKASYLYVTNDSKNDGNPWDSLPNYWEKEVSEFRK